MVIMKCEVMRRPLAVTALFFFMGALFHVTFQPKRKVCQPSSKMNFTVQKGRSFSRRDGRKLSTSEKTASSSKADSLETPASSIKSTLIAQQMDIAHSSGRIIGATS